MLIQDFKTYKPLLSAIKNEYDLYITYLEELIKELLPLKVSALTICSCLVLDRSLLTCTINYPQ